MATKGLSKNQRVKAFWSRDGAVTTDWYGGVASSGRGSRGRRGKEVRDKGRKSQTPQASSVLHGDGTSQGHFVRGRPGAAIVDTSCHSVSMESHVKGHASSPGSSYAQASCESCEKPHPVYQAEPAVGELLVGEGGGGKERRGVV